MLPVFCGAVFLPIFGDAITADTRELWGDTLLGTLCLSTHVWCGVTNSWGHFDCLFLCCGVTASWGCFDCWHTRVVGWHASLFCVLWDDTSDTLVRSPRSVHVFITQENIHKIKVSQPMFLFKPNFRLGHPENYSFSLSLIIFSLTIFSGSKYPENFSFNFENRRTDHNWFCFENDITAGEMNISGERPRPMVQSLGGNDGANMGSESEQGGASVSNAVRCWCQFPISDVCCYCQQSHTIYGQESWEDTVLCKLRVVLHLVFLF